MQSGDYKIYIIYISSIHPEVNMKSIYFVTILKSTIYFVTILKSIYFVTLYKKNE